MNIAPLECCRNVSSNSRDRILHRSLDFDHLQSVNHVYQPRNSAQTNRARAKVLGDVRDRVTELRTASLRQHNHFPHSVIPQPRCILPSSYHSISYELRITKHQCPQNQLSEPLRNSASPPNLALRHHKQLPPWHSSSLAAHTPSPPSSKATRTSQRSARTAATSAHESTSAGSGSRSASFPVRRLFPFAPNNQTNKHRKLTTSSVIPFSLKPDKDVGCHICKFYQDLRHRPDVQNMMEGGGGGQPIPMQGGPHGWNQHPQQQPQYAQGGQPQYK